MLFHTIKLDHIEDLKNCKFSKPDYSPSIDNSYIENELFKFLIENEMNRFLFGYITRIDTTKLDLLKVYDKLLDPNQLKQICRESFIKKFECPNCGHLLFRKHLYELENTNFHELDCPNCGKKNLINYLSLKDDFEIKRIDIIKFLERLVKIGIYSKKLVSSCNTCTTLEIINHNELAELSCACGDLREIKFIYESNYGFMTKEDGYWFEWYVYKLCDHIYSDVYKNYKCRFELNGKNNECELDVLTISSDNKVTVYECKDHMYHLKDKLSMKDYMDNVAKIMHIADKITIVSSLKNVKPYFKEETDELVECEIEFIEGMDLEKRFLHEDSIITFFENQNYDIVPLFTKLPPVKKQTILSKIMELIIENESKNYLEIINNIFNRTLWDEIVYPEESIVKDTITTSINNISNNLSIIESLEYIKNLYFRKPEFFNEEFDLNNILRIGIQFLTSNPFDGYEMRAPFYYFISSYFKREEINVETLDETIVQEFLLKFIPMIKIYYGTSSLKNTLTVFKKLWAFKTSEIENELCNTLIQEYSMRPSKGHIISEFINEIEDITQDNKKRVESNINSKQIKPKRVIRSN